MYGNGARLSAKERTIDLAKALPLLQSMTGFARHEANHEGEQGSWQWVWEARSLNNRGLDLKCRLPNWLDQMETEIRSQLAGKISRGSVTFSLQLRTERGESQLVLNEAALAQVLRALEIVKEATECTLPNPDGILRQPGVLSVQEEQRTPETREELAQALLESFAHVLGDLVTARRDEGARLATIIEEQLMRIATLAQAARVCAETLPETIKARLISQLEALLGEALDPDRLAQEAALLVVKGDVCEELDRLDAHLAAAHELLAQGSVIGRKFDFLVQEFNREANTLCSKAQTIELKQIGLSLKTVIDQMREQIQNIE